MDQQPRSFRLRSIINSVLLIVGVALVAGLALERRWREERGRAVEERALQDLRKKWESREPPRKISEEEEESIRRLGGQLR